MDTIVGLKEVRENMEKIVKSVRGGRSFIVVRRSRPLFRLSPVEKEEGEWEEVIDFTKIKRGGVDLQDLMARL